MGTLDAFNAHHIATNHVLHHFHCTHFPSHTFISPHPSINSYHPTPPFRPPRPAISVPNLPTEARCTRRTPQKRREYKLHCTHHGSARSCGFKCTVVRTSVQRSDQYDDENDATNNPIPSKPRDNHCSLRGSSTRWENTPSILLRVVRQYYCRCGNGRC